MKEPLTVSLIEGDEVTRRIFSRWVNETPGFRCLNTYANAASAMRRLPDAAPDVVFADRLLPHILDCVRELRTLRPVTQFVLWGVHTDADLICEALAAGALGCIPKSTARADLTGTLALVQRGIWPMDNAVARKILHSFLSDRAKHAQAMELVSSERMVLEFLARGYGVSEIAGALNVSTSTVEIHLRGVYAKYRARAQSLLATTTDSGSSIASSSEKTLRTSPGFLSIKGLAGSRTVTITP